MSIKSDKDSAHHVETAMASDNNTSKNDEGDPIEDEVVDNEEMTDNEGLPIDKGWAWMILAGCFLNAALTVGYIRSLGLFFVEFLKTFQESAATTTMILGVKSLSESLFSLITMHVLLEFWGIRKTVQLGSTFFTVAILSSSFAPNIAFLICSHILLGIGQSMIQAPGLVLISKYFKKRRSLATTTASSAVSFSIAVFPLLAEYLLNEYGVRGAMLIISGLTMNMWVGAALYRPLEYFKLNKKTRNRDKEETETMLKDSDHLELGKNGKPCENPKGNESKTCVEADTNNEIFSPLSRSFETYDKYNFSPDNDEQFRRRTYSEGSKNKHCETMKLYKQCATISQSKKLAYPSNTDLVDLSADVTHQSVEQMDQISDQTMKRVSPILRNIRKILNAFDFSLFKKPSFLIIAALTHVGVILKLAQMYLPARVNELGFTQSDAAILLLISGILDFFCRIFYGFLADLKFLKVHYIMAIGLSITGLATHFVAFYTTFPLLITYAVLVGIFGSAYQCLLPVVIVEFLGVDYLAKTLGFTTLFQGFALGVTHPIIGGIRDLSGSYVACYHYIGTSSFLAAGLLVCEPLVRRCGKTRTKTEGRE